VPKLLSVNPSRLRANPFNSNLVSPENEAKLARSIEELGQFKPIVVRELPDEETGTNFEILGGEHRWQAAIAGGLDEVYIFNLGVIDDVTAKKIAVADNARYGTDDTLALAKILEQIGTPEQIQEFLPFTNSDISSIFAASDIALDELDLPDSFETKVEPIELRSERAPKTHTIMRFKVPLSDAERITEKVTKTQKRHSFDSSDELTNAGDALVHLLFAGGEEE
jgi:ParB-like chromosome segregation protein Spo0J